MRITQLGSGGNFPIPMPTCSCNVCEEARDRGGRYVRRGSATYVHDDNILIDTPELIGPMLNDAEIRRVDHILLTHFHGDHVNGLAVVQSLGRGEFPLEGWEPRDPPTVYMSESTYESLEKSQPYRLKYEDVFIDVELVNDGDSVSLGETTVTAVESPIAGSPRHRMSNFILERDEATVLVSPDETKGLDLSKIPPEVTLWIKECGMFRVDPTGSPVMSDSLWEQERETELTFEETLSQIDHVEPERTVLTELEEIYQRSYDDYRSLESKYANRNLAFSFDGMEITV